ncbi:hypothetical protein Tco_0539270 [Tanacetum coccineum]
MFYKKNIDYVYLLWEDFLFQIENKEAKKTNKMSYPRFTKIIIDYFMSNDQSISRRNKMFWHIARDDTMFTTMRYISRHEDTQVYGTILLKDLTNQAMLESKAYKTYYAFASGEKTPKPNGSGDGTNFESGVPDEQHLKTTGVDEGTGTIPGVPDVPKYESKSEKVSWGDSGEEDKDDENDYEDKSDDGKDDDDANDDDDQEGDDTNDDDKETDSDKTESEEEKIDDEEVSSDQKVSTPPDYELTKEEENKEDEDKDKEGEHEEEEEEEEDELYRDLNINLERSDAEMTDAQANQDTEDTHVTLTNVPPVVHQQSIDSILYQDTQSDTLVNVPVSVAAETPSSVTTIPQLPIPNIQPLQQTPTSTTTTTNPIMTLPEIHNFASLFQFDQRVSTLESEMSEFRQTSQFSEVVSSIPGIVDTYLASKIKEAVDVVVQLQTNKLREEAQEDNQEFLNQVDSTMKAIIKEQVQAQVSKICQYMQLPTLDKETSLLRMVTVVTLKKGRDDQDKDVRTLPLDQNDGRRGTHMIIAVTSLKIMRWFGYSHLEEIIVRRHDDQLYKFREGNFKRLRRQDIEDMLLLLVQISYNLQLRRYERIEDLQLEVESYQKKINLKNPYIYCSNLRRMIAYTAYLDIQGIIYVDEMNRKRLMRTDELHKFSVGTLNHVRTALNDIDHYDKLFYDFLTPALVGIEMVAVTPAFDHLKQKSPMHYLVILPETSECILSKKEGNEIRAEKIVRNENPLAVFADAQPYQETYYQAPKPQKSYPPPTKQSSSTKLHASTRHKGKEIAKPITPPSELASEEDSDLEQAQRDKDMQKNLALIAKYFKKLYKPTKSNWHFAKECRKPKRAKDYTYHKEKMLMCKQAKKGVPLQAEQADWLVDMDEEVHEQELESHYMYMYMEKIQEVHNVDSGPSFDVEPLEKLINVHLSAFWKLFEVISSQELIELLSSGLEALGAIRTGFLGHSLRKSGLGSETTKIQGMLANNLQVLDEEQLAFLADPRITDGQDNQPTIIHNVAFHTDDLDAYDSDCDDISSAKAVLMSNLSSYSSVVLSEYLQQTQNAIVQDTNSSALQDYTIMSVFDQLSEQMSNHVTNWDKANQETKTVNESLTTELEDIRNECALKQEIDSLKQNLSKQAKEKESLLQTLTVFKKESKEKENKYMDKEIDLEKKIKELNNIVYKVGQSAQTIAQRIKPTLYDGNVLSNKHNVISVIDEEETLILEEESRSNMLEKQNDPILKEKKINISQINYSELNKLAQDFEKHFVPQKEMSAEQAFWLQLSNLISE